MIVKPIVPRQQANRDVETAIDHYLGEAGEAVALGFINALESAYRHITQHPASGSGRYAYDLNLPGLKFWPLKGYPYLVFYRDGETHIDVWRVLHAVRDIPAWMREPDVS
ncbi:MAG: plasmid stabilization protein [Alphaproteobacteria bacterium RIFOXYD12_FULL_60_8]|nr:MAG: plasmid stabilization protein [Alphaproteobacteria bacterium RIFOXYD12_FULL_60_8]